jgi:hypothetical protein
MEPGWLYSADLLNVATEMGATDEAVQRAIREAEASADAYFVPFEMDVMAALESLRQRVFANRRYRIAGSRPGTSIRSIQEALTLAGADGTGSILDITN